MAVSKGSSECLHMQNCLVFGPAEMLSMNAFEDNW